jgi:hypothetical protein
VALAQQNPQLSWEGYVSGSAVLKIQGDRVDVQGRDTDSVQRPRVSMYEPLPASRQNIQMDVVRGLGRVNVVEQPAPRNNYTATVRIDPVGEQHELYRIDFFWNPEGRDRWNQSRRDRRGGYDYGGRRGADYGYRGRQAPAGPGEMTWSGTVDHEALVEIRGGTASVQRLQGQRVTDESADFSGALPRDFATDVRLEKLEGRGKVELVSQPAQGNNYTAVVRVFDEDGGADHYAFRLVWEGGGYGTRSRSAADPDRTGGILTPSGGYLEPSGKLGQSSTMRWRGRVDGTVRVSVRGNRAWTTRVSGAPVSSENAQFGTALPRADVDVDVDKVSGRGDVDVVQQPSAQNGYTLVFEIEDDSAGADNYEIEVNWR